MFSNKFNCELVNLIALYRQSDKDCAPSAWKILSGTKQELENIVQSLGDCVEEDILISRGRGATATCWAHPLVHKSWADWATGRRFKNPHENLAHSEQQVISPELIDVEVVPNPMSTHPTSRSVDQDETAQCDLAIFNFEGQEVRFVGTADKPEWVAADVVAILHPESQKKDRANYLSTVPTEWKGMKQIQTHGGKQSMTTLFEPGLYHLIVRSDSMKAVPFQNWVFEDLLPSIRKAGSYSVSKSQAPQPQSQPESNGNSFIQMVEQDLEHVGVATAFIKGWKYDTLKVLHPEHAQMFDSARKLIMTTCVEEESLCNVTTISQLIDANYNLKIMPEHLNKLWVQMGLQILSNTSKCKWILTSLGKKYAKVAPYSTNREGFQILWSTSIVEITYEYLKSHPSTPQQSIF